MAIVNYMKKFALPVSKLFYNHVPKGTVRSDQARA